MKSHLTPEDIASLSEGMSTQSQENQAKEHLAQCYACFEAYSELVRTRVEFDLRPDEPPVDPALLGAGFAVSDAGGFSSASRPGFRRWSRIALAMGTAVVLAIAGLWINLELSWNRTVDPIRETVAMAGDGFDYPGIASSERPEDSVSFRSGQGNLSPEFKVSQTTLRERYEGNEDDAKISFWLGSALIISGEFKTARALLDIARVKNPQDARVWNLDGILAAKEGNLEESEQIFKTLLEHHPDDPSARVNLERVSRLLEGS